MEQEINNGEIKTNHISIENQNLEESYEAHESDEYREEEEEDIICPEFESQLGKKEYWDKFYQQEIKQFKNNTDLIGEVWFGEQVQNKVVNYIKDKFSSLKEIPILDVGCGNAAFLLKLANLNFTNLHGMDYSQKSIELAEEILKEKIPEKCNMVNLYAEDINCPEERILKYELIHDKGTFDAFLSMKEHKVEDYIKFILLNSFKKSKDSVENHSINPQNNDNFETTFILTSCNYSLPELEKMFLYDGSKFIFVENIPHKSFNFGGSAGQVVTTIIFKIKN